MTENQHVSAFSVPFSRVSLSKAAHRLGCTEGDVARLCHSGELACTKVDGAWFTTLESLYLFRGRAHLSTLTRPTKRRMQVGAALSSFAAVALLVSALTVVGSMAFAETYVGHTTSRVIASISPRVNQSALALLPDEWLSRLRSFLFGGVESSEDIPPPVRVVESSFEENSIPVVTQPPVPSERQQSEPPAPPPTIVQRVTELVSVSGISEADLTTRLQELENSLRAELYRYTARSESGISGNYRAIQLTNRIDNLDGVTIRNATIVGGSLSGTSGVGATSLDGLSDVVVTTPTYGNVLLYDGTTWNNVATSSLGITSGGSSIGEAFSLTQNVFSQSALAPTTTQNLLITGTGTSTIAGGLEVWRQIASPYFTATSTSATSTFGGAVEVFSLASTSQLRVSTSLSIGSLSGFLKATAGVVATSLIDLAADVTGLLPVSNGGTGWASLQANTILLGNGTGRLATTSAGTNGQVLSLVSGVPAWVATTTYNAPLSYSAGAVSLSTSGDWTGTFDGQEGSYYLSRANHTGSQTASTISDFDASVNSYINASTTIPKTYSSNTFTASQFFSSPVGIGTTTSDSILSVLSADPVLLIKDSETGTANTNVTLRFAESGASGVTDNYVDFNLGASGLFSFIDNYTAGGGTGTRFVVSDSGNFGIGTTTPWRKLSVADTVANSQFALAYDTTRYATLQVTSVGDLVIEAQGDDVSLLDENLYVCTGGSCPSAPSGTGHLIVEGQLVLPNGTAPTVSAVGSIAVDTTDNQLLIATSTNASFPAVFPLEQPLFSMTVGSTTPEFISSGTIPIGKWVSEGREITRFSCFVKTGTSKVVNVTDGTNDTETITCGTTHTADTSVDTNATFTAGELWYLEFGATSGAVDYVTFTAYGYITRE